MRDVNISNLTLNLGFKIIGDDAGDTAGYSVSSAGDINNDGISDIIVGAPGAGRNSRDNAYAAGAAYVVYGKRGGLTNIDLSRFTTTEGFKIGGSATSIWDDGWPTNYGHWNNFGDSAGTSVSGAGDVNGDGIDDVIVGAPGTFREGPGLDLRTAGTVYVIYGRNGVPEGISLPGFTAAEGLKIIGNGYYSIRIGYSTSGIGDMNGDGFNDIIVVAPSAGYTVGRSGAGIAYIVYGNNSTTSVDLNSFKSTQGFKIIGSIGSAVSSAGDVNGDGINDVIVSGSYNAYVVYGKSIGLGDIYLERLTLEQGFNITGTSNLRSAGDINDDGIDDLIVGKYAGAFYVIYGNNTRLASIDLASFTSAQGFRIIDVDYKTRDYVIGRAGDINGDGFDDVIVSASDKVYIVYGNSTGLNDIYLASFTSTQGFKIIGANNAASAGDVNADGINDVIIGSPNYGDYHCGNHYGNVYNSNCGAAYVVYGRMTVIGTSGDDVLFPGSKLEEIDGLAGIDTVNYSQSNSNVTVNLAANIGIGGIATGDTIFNCENIVGSIYNDTLIGDSNANNIQGGAGADTLNGGAGSDTIIYIGSPNGVVISLESNTASGGDATGDNISNFENIVGSDYSDRLTGDSNANDIQGRDGDDVIEGRAGADVLDGGDGTDTLSYTSSEAGVMVNLATYTTSGGDAAGDIISKFENIIGSGFSDTLTGDASSNNIQGNAGDDIIEGGEGGDTLDGAAGIDTLSYRNSSAAVIVNLKTNTVSGGDATGDTISNFENIIGSAYADTLTGDAANNNIQGAGGDDLIEGGAGSDVLEGGEGIDTLSYDSSTIGVTVALATNSVSGGDATGDMISGFENIIGSRMADTLSGDANANNIQGGSGDDIIEGGWGSDLLDGGTGADTLSYSNSTEGVMVNLVTHTVSGGDATGDTISNFENIIGSKQGDTLSGDTGVNNIQGGAGDDVIEGKEGADLLNGGVGIDTASYAHSELGVTVSLEMGTGLGGDAAGDTISGFENLLGSSFADILTGDANANAIQGGAGNDIIEGKAGSDTLDGGAGIDTVSYASSSAGVTVSLASGIGIGADAAGDVISNFENLIGSKYADVLTGDVGDNDIQGGASDDILKDGGGGNDVFTGGLEADTFVISPSKGIVTITDFNGTEDKIDLDRFDVSFTQVINSARNKDHNCEITLSSKKIVLLNLDKNDIQKSWFSSLAAEAPTVQPTPKKGLTKQDIAKLAGSLVSTTITVGSFIAKSYQYYKPGILGHDKFYSFASSIVPRIIMKTTANTVKAAENAIKVVVDLKAQYEQINSDLVYDQLQKALLKAEHTCRNAATEAEIIKEAAQNLLLTAQGKAAEAAQVTLNTAAAAFDFYTRHYQEYSKELQADSSDGEGVEMEGLGLLER